MGFWLLHPAQIRSTRLRIPALPEPNLTAQSWFFHVFSMIQPHEKICGDLCKHEFSGEFSNVWNNDLMFGIIMALIIKIIIIFLITLLFLILKLFYLKPKLRKLKIYNILINMYNDVPVFFLFSLMWKVLILSLFMY